MQETQDESAVLWLDEIQGAIWQSNKDTQEAQRCTYQLFYFYFSGGWGDEVLHISIFISELGQNEEVLGEQFARRYS